MSDTTKQFNDSTLTVVIVPGLRDHVEDHWQTILAGELGRVVTVPPLEVDGLSRAARVSALDDVLADIDGPVLLVAHSAGCMITVHWAQHHDRDVVGALLAAPADLESPLPDGYPDSNSLDAAGWTPIPRTTLPFPTIVAASQNDPLGDYSRVAQLAEDWGSRLVDVGHVGHLNPTAGFGPWPRAQSLINDVLAMAGWPALAHASATG